MRSYSNGWKAGTSVQKASTEAEKVGSGLKKRKVKANEEKKKVHACILYRLIHA